MIKRDYVSPTTLLEQVRGTVPFLVAGRAEESAPARLIELGAGPRGFLDVLDRGRQVEGAAGDVEWLEDYFALCLACHHATVASFVPTDVDTKIRGLLWRDVPSVECAERLFRYTLRARAWSIDGISTRATALAGLGPVSGHDGEMLSVLAAAFGTFLRLGAAELAKEAASVIDDELRREADEFQFALRTPGCELDGLRIAMSLIHNVGDLDNGFGFWPTGAPFRDAQAPYARLAHENTKPYGGAYRAAGEVYRRAMACEGHRHYPLRGVRALRRSADFLLPLGPFFDDWGGTIAAHRQLSDEERAEVLAALLTGCRKIEGQRGYFRAVAGFLEGCRGPVERLVRLMPSSARSDWKDAAIRKQTAVPRGSFESMMRKLFRAR